MLTIILDALEHRPGKVHRGFRTKPMWHKNLQQWTESKIRSTAVVPIFFGLGLGYVGGWSGSVDNEHVADLNSLVMEYAVPAAIFVAVAQASRDTAMQVTICNVAHPLLAAGLAWLFALAPSPRARRSC